MTAHEDGHPHGRWLCEQVRASLDAIRPGCTIKSGKATCNISNGRAQVYVYHRKKKPAVRLYYVHPIGDWKRLEAIAKSRGISYTLRGGNLTTGWSATTALYTELGDSVDVIQAINGLAEYRGWSHRLSLDGDDDGPNSPNARIEGDSKVAPRTVYERSRGLRDACIAHHGHRCCACGLDMGQRYGHYGAGYIHVHHLNPLGEMGSAHAVDPIQDLRPLCPNCHSMVHRVSPPLSIAELQAAIQS